jgi:hypothetical protein
MNRLLLIPAAVALVAVGGGATPAAASTTYGTAPVTVADTNAGGSTPQLLQVSVGHHAAYDRVVFRFSGHAPGYSVRYVPKVLADPSGNPVSLRGNAYLSVTMHSVASAQAGKPAAPQGRQRPLFPELREIAGSGDFEGYVSFGLGLKAKTGFRTFVLTNPDRLVVDVRIPAAAARTPAATPTSATPGTTTGELAATGSAAPWAVVAGSALLLLGGIAHRLARRRPNRIAA